MPQLHTGAACDTLETIKTPNFLPIPEVVWQERREPSIKQNNLIIIEKWLNNTTVSRNSDDN